MKVRKNLLGLLAGFLIFSIFSPSMSVEAASKKTLPVSSNNINNHNYYTYAQTIKSHLYVEDKIINRVEYIDSYYYDGNDKYTDNSYVLVETYDDKFQLKSQKTINQELPIWGGFHAGKKYNFLIYGQENMEENDNKEVIRIVKYSKDWKRLDHASLKGLESYNYYSDDGYGRMFSSATTIPFRAGSLRVAEHENELHIRTSRQMYKSSDGLHHQANLFFKVDIENLEVKITDFGYVSHSFNQYLLIDKDNNYVSIDHGDAYPRSIAMYKFDIVKNDNSWFLNEGLDLVTFDGEIGENYTGASVGGLEETQNGYVVGYNYQDYQSSKPRDIYFKYIPKGDLVSTKVVSTKLSNNIITLTPHVVSVGLNNGYVLWNEVSDGLKNKGNLFIDRDIKKLVYVTYDANGKLSAKKSIKNTPLSDSKPIPYKNGLLWYTTEESQPIFYHLISSGVNKYDISKINKVNLNGWVSEGINWYYYRNNEKETGWTKVRSVWYHMDFRGVMETGWKKLNNKWYYFAKDGAMQTHWFKDSSNWYYANASGEMQKGFIKSANQWYLLNNAGAMETGWNRVDNKWYYLNSNGVMQTRWIFVNNNWYYLDGSGVMQTGWIKSNNQWYYMNKSGAMQTGKVNIAGKNYIFDANGVLQ